MATTGAQIAFRLTPQITKKLDGVKSRLAADPNLAASGRVTRTTVAKIAFMRGLEVLEREYSGKS